MPDKKLVIVESPAKARTISRFLGGNYEITASMGHVRDLPERTLGVDVENGFEPIYVETKKEVVARLSKSARDASDIYLAPDPDREGEAIAWHLKELLTRKNKPVAFHRVVFHEITKSAVARAFQEPGTINEKLVDAQQARRVLDRLVGYKVSPLLWSKISQGKALSAGRVQSVALRIVCEREREIQAFEPKEYWVFDGIFEPLASPGAANRFKTRLIKIDGKKAEIGDAETAEALHKAIDAATGFAVSSKEVKPQSRKAPPPFITSTLQQSAGSSLRMNAARTMRIAQGLYEGVDIGTGGPTGLITYMRTDSFAVAKEAVAACRAFVETKYGKEYLPPKPPVYKSRASAQGAHEAIRPTDVTLAPEKVKRFLDNDQLRLYTLIWKRFVASQMAPAKLERTVVQVENAKGDGTFTFQAQAVVTVFPGFTVLFPAKDDAAETAENGEEKQDNAAILGKLDRGDGCKAAETAKEQKFTEPPPRYTEATLIRELEANGIGRPSTYATIVGTIQNRGYCQRENNKLVPTNIGFEVNDYLVASLPALFQVGFTAEMEKKLDEIEDGKIDWRQMLKDFNDNLAAWLGEAKFANAPEAPKATALIQAMEKIAEWEKPSKVNNRSRNDKNFFESIKKQFEEGSAITEKQWGALLGLALKYKAQVPNLDAIAAEHGFQEDIVRVEEQRAQRAAVAAEREKAMASEDTAKLKEAFGILAEAPWEPPTKKGARTYDDKKFFTSLKKQLDEGRPLSEKQIAAFGKLAARYAGRLDGGEKIADLIGVDAKSAEPALPPENAKEIETMLETLSKISKWAEPVKKGRRVYDDKDFFESLNRQYASRKNLSPKQVAALKRLAAKYADKT